MRIADRRETILSHDTARRHSFRVRSVLHAVIFVLAFIFTTGALVLSVLLWVRPGQLLWLVLTGVGASGVFVASFAALRFVTLKHLFPDPVAVQSGEPVHHWSKSIAYGLVALVVAILAAGLLINVVSAFTV